jgi:hypothetical protein
VWLAFAIGIGTLIVSAIVALTYRDHGPSVAAALLCAVISAWTIAASRAFTHATVHHLILASALALSAVAILGLTAHELAVERRAHMGGMDGSEGERNLAAA